MSDALRILPKLEVIEQLRAQVSASSRARGITPRNETLATREVDTGELGTLVSGLVQLATSHRARIFELSMQALEHFVVGDTGTAVQALLEAGDLEEKASRLAAATAWYEAGLAAARPLRRRLPEIEALLRLGHVLAIRGELEEAGRRFQRALAIAEGEGEAVAAVRACIGLGSLALEQDLWMGARSWFARGLKLGLDDDSIRAELMLGLARAEGNGPQTDVAELHASEVLSMAETLGEVSLASLALIERSRIAARQGKLEAAIGDDRDALDRILRRGGHPDVEIAARLHLAQLHIELGQLLLAEDEIRAAERASIAEHRVHDLIRSYIALGDLRRRQSDDEGFILFETALELCRELESQPRLEAEVCLAYGEYRAAIGDTEAASLYVVRARELLRAPQGDGLLSRIDAALQLLRAT